MRELSYRFVTIVLSLVLAVIAVEGCVRTDVSATRHWISHLSLGPHGWVNSLALGLAGVAAAVLGRLVHAEQAGRWAARWTTLTGTGLAIAALFVSDAPPGTQYADTLTVHGQVHNLGGGLTFLGLFATPLASRHLGRPRSAVLVAVIVGGCWIAAGVMAAVSFSGPVFSAVVRLRAPYFSTINTRFTATESSHVELRLPYRRRLTNRLGAIRALHRQGQQRRDMRRGCDRTDRCSDARWRSPYTESPTTARPPSGSVLMKISPPNPQEESFDAFRNFR